MNNIKDQISDFENNVAEMADTAKQENKDNATKKN